MDNTNDPQNFANAPRYGYTKTGEKIEPPEGWTIVPEGSIVGARYRVFWRDRPFWSVPTTIGPELQKNQRRAGLTDSVLAVAVPTTPPGYGIADGVPIVPPMGYKIIPEYTPLPRDFVAYDFLKGTWTVPHDTMPVFANVWNNFRAYAVRKDQPKQEPRPYGPASMVNKPHPYACRCHTPRPDTPRYTRAVSWMARAYFDDGQNITIDVIDKNDVRMIAEIFDISAHVVAYDVLREIMQVSRDADGHPRLPLKGGE